MNKITGNELVDKCLTIRQHFAVIAMQGLIANGEHNNSDLGGIDKIRAIAAYSVQFAGALIDELNKKYETQI